MTIRVTIKSTVLPLDIINNYLPVVAVEKESPLNGSGKGIVS